MDTDVMIKANDRLNCFLHCDRSAMKETFSACRQQGVVLCPKGWILTGWSVLSARRSKNTSSWFIGVHPCSSCKKDAFKQMNKSVCNNDARRWTQMNDKRRCRLNCFLHCDRAAMKETLSRLSAAKDCTVPEGLDIDRLICSINQTVKEYSIRFIGVHQRSSCEKEALQQLKKSSL